MFIFFHVAIPLLLFELKSVRKSVELQRFALIIGSMIPDILEKPLAILHLSSGRGFFHAPLLWIFIWGVLTLLFKRKDIIKGICIGSLIHLILDLPYISILWPFVQYNFGYNENPFLVWLEILFHDPVVITTEIVGCVSLLFIVYRNQLWFHMTKIQEYLFIPTKSIL